MTDPPGDSTEPPDRRAGLALVAVAAVVLLGAALAPALVGARPANQIPIATVSDNLTAPDAEGWAEAPAVAVPLASAPSGLPDAETTSVNELHVRAAQTDERLFLRLRWPDATADRNASSPREFADAVAVQVPVNTSARPPIAMGSTRNLVNVWYWSAPVGTQELLAGGPGTTTAFPAPAVAVETARTTVDGEAGWAVTYARALEPAGANRTRITGEADLDVAFGVWNGSTMERSGRKAVSDWYHLPFGPGPQGPPYATLLWALAGIALVVVVAVTVYGVRQAGRDGGAGQ